MGGRRLSKMEGLGRLRFTIDTCRQPSRLKPPGTNARPRSRGDPRGLPRRTRGGGPLNERGRPPRGGWRPATLYRASSGEEAPKRIQLQQGGGKRCNEGVQAGEPNRALCCLHLGEKTMAHGCCEGTTGSAGAVFSSLPGTPPRGGANPSSSRRSIGCPGARADPLQDGGAAREAVAEIAPQSERVRTNATTSVISSSER